MVGRLKWGVFILEAINAGISYGKNMILQNVNFTAHKNTGTALLGRNGSGKSSLLKVLSGVLKPDCGEVSLDGISVFNKGTRLKIGFVPQEDICIDDLSVLDNLIFWGASNGLSKSAVMGNDAVKLLGLEDELKKKARFLSGGTRKRLCIAASILHEPSVLILDEPFSAVDVVSRGELIKYLKRVRGDGKILIMTSHYASELVSLCEGYYIITEKTVEPIGDVIGFCANPDEYVEKIIKKGC